MNATEKITAAIARLDAQRTGSEVQGEWLIERVNECTCAGADQYGHEAHERGCGTLPLTNDPLTVTLHRTIDAQLDLLNAAKDMKGVYRDVAGELVSSRFGHAVLALADAILGVTS